MEKIPRYPANSKANTETRQGEAMKGIDGIGKAVLCDPRNRQALEAAGVPLPTLPMPEEELGRKCIVKNERQLQKHCESLLVFRGYNRMTPSAAESPFSGDVLPKGWFGHLANPRKNPLMPDLMVLSFWNRKPCLLVEFKIPPLKWQPGQQAMVNRGIWQVVTSVPDFLSLLLGWENTPCNWEGRR